MVPPAKGVQSDLCGVALSLGGPICNQIQEQTTQVCVPSSGPQGGPVCN